MVILYILKSKNNQMKYIGITNNLSKRLTQHRSGQSSVSKMLGDFECVYTEKYTNHKTARVREKYLKSGVGREWMKENI